MGNIFEIFKRDIKSICTHFVPFIICLSLIVIGSCYAIFNIFSNWDPYGNTDRVTILVYNEDKGYKAEDGTVSNQGQSVVENLKKNKSINWQVAESRNALIEAVTNGYVYAGIVIEEDFSEKMENFLSAQSGFSKPVISYYENDKKNAVAIKVVDTAVQTLQHTINKTFLETVVQTVFEHTGQIVDENSQMDAVQVLTEKLTGINENLKEYDEIITQFVDGNQGMHQKLESAEGALGTIDSSVESGREDITQIQGGLSDTKTSYNEFSASINSLLNDLEKSLETVAGDIENSKLMTGDVEALNNVLNQTLEDVSDLYNTAFSVNEQYESESMKNFLAAIQTLTQSLGTVREINITAPDLSALNQELNECASQIAGLENTYNNVITPEINSVLDNMTIVLDNIVGTLDTLSAMTGNVGTVFRNIDTTISYTDQSLTQVQAVVHEISAKISAVLEQVNNSEENEKMQVLVEFLTGDAESYSKYFAEIIQMDTTVVFPVDNYGGACSVFYIVLALYVLALLLTSELKVDADITGLHNVRSYQTYFGRYLTFCTLGLLQSLFLSTFCIYVFKLQCQHVLPFFLVNAFISFVFTNITYSCVKTFGMMYGRTIATILVIFQMSTGGCTYSVEQIPDSMRWLSPYMPFTYCSNALREVCFGYSGYDLSIYLGKLCVFVVIALFFGLVVRIPLVNLIRFIDSRLLETGLMGVETGEEEEEEVSHE